MSSFEEYNKVDENKPSPGKTSIRLSALNPTVRERVQKFDVGNDGALSIEEAIQGLVTLQKQSNNYKKMIWFLIPIICLVLAGTFGTAILANNLTKEINQNGGILTSKVDNTPIRTVEAVSKDLMYSSLFSEDYNKITKLHFGGVSLNVNQMYQVNYEDGYKSVYVNTDMIYFGLNQTGEYVINYNQGFENNPISHLMYKTVNRTLSDYLMVVDYYRSVLGYQPTFDDINKYTFMYTVSTTKVPQDYSVSDNSDLLSPGIAKISTSRLASLEASDSSPCKDNDSIFPSVCKNKPCYECTFHNDDKGNGLPSQWQVCTSVLLSADYLSGCHRAN
jgi:hypothetical protein